VFIGHFAVAFATKKVAPKASLGTLVIAAAFPDVVWPVLVLLGVERFRIVPGFTAINPFEFVYYPWSHSLLMTGRLGGALRDRLSDGNGRSRRSDVGRNRRRQLLVLDCVTHRPDLQLYPGGSERLGLGLWESLPATFSVEGLMFAAGIALYTQSTKVKDRLGTVAWWVSIALLVILYVPGPWSPPPPSEDAVAILGIIALAILGPWAYWIDRHRVPVS